MRAKLIYINWCFGFLGLFIDSEQSPLWAVAVGFIWFVAASSLLIYADRKGWMKEFIKQFKIDEL